MDPKQGLICSLTDALADFEESCEDFELDEVAEKEYVVKEMAAVGNYSAKNQLNYKKTQDYAFGLIILGIVIALITFFYSGSIGIGTGMIATGIIFTFIGSKQEQIHKDYLESKEEDDD